VRPVSAAFLRTLRGSHVMVTRARVCTTFQTGTNPTGTEIGILAGDVVHDATADVRATLDLTTDGTGMWPRNASALLAPYGNEVFVERGIQYGNGTREWVSQGYFRIETPEQDEVPDGPIRLQCKDRMAGIIDARMVAPRQFVAGTTLGAIVENLVEEVYPSATIEYDDGSATSGAFTWRALIVEEDRYAFLNDLITGAGKIWYWDYRGVLVVKSPPSLTTPVWDVTHGRDGVLVQMSRALTREGVFNAVVATGEAADTIAPARAVAVDQNPQSPTYYFGRFGKVPRQYSSPFIVDNDQAFSAASALLKRSLGLPYTVNFGAVPNPALEPYDPITVVYPPRSRSTSGITETHIVDQLTIPLAADGALTAKTREQQLVTIGQI
jgi:hypothetical protein